METHIDVEPLPYKTRQRTFAFLVFVFLASLPFLYIYATGYRFDFAKPTALVSTGGMYVAVDGTGAEIYIDGELVRETRTFRKAFYAQSLDTGTHRVHVQKEGHQTWVKELPVSKHRVTEAAAFNLPLVPQLRVITQWQTATGTMVMKTPLVFASSTNEVMATSTKSTSTLLVNQEYVSLLPNFSTTTHKESAAAQLRELLTNSTSTAEDAVQSTTTIISGGAKIHMRDDDVFVTWVGAFEDMPYYYCAPAFPPYGTSTSVVDVIEEELEDVLKEDTLQIHPVQTLPQDTNCDPTIRIDRKSQEVRDFDFFPSNTDFVLMVLTDGVYMVEVDNRAWQNVQPVIQGQDLHMYIENGNIFVLDGEVIYQVQVQST